VNAGKASVQKSKEQSKDFVGAQDADSTPFIQLNISLAECLGKKESSAKVRRLRAFQFSIQEFIIKIDTSIINDNMKFITELTAVFISPDSFEIPASSESF